MYIQILERCLVHVAVFSYPSNQFGYARRAGLDVVACTSFCLAVAIHASPHGERVR